MQVKLYDVTTPEFITYVKTEINPEELYYPGDFIMITKDNYNDIDGAIQFIERDKIKFFGSNDIVEVIRVIGKPAYVNAEPHLSYLVKGETGYGCIRSSGTTLHKANDLARIEAHLKLEIKHANERRSSL